VKGGPYSARRTCRASRTAWVLSAAAVAALALPTIRTVDAGPQIQRYISLTAKPNPLALGTVSEPGTHDVANALDVHFTANCSHGDMLISTAGLQSGSGDLIPPERIFVRLPGTGNYVAMSSPVSVSLPAGPVIHDFELRFRVQVEPTDPAGTYSGAFQTLVDGGTGWPDVPGSGVLASLEIEMYCGYTIQGGKGYVHLGRPFEASQEDLTLRPTGSLVSSGSMYIGLNLSGVGAPGEDPIEKDGNGDPTGRVLGAMEGTVDVMGRSIADEEFDVAVLLSWDGGNTHHAPDYFGTSPDGAVSGALWWLVGSGAPGQYDLSWEVRLLPGVGQADGNYDFQSEIVVTPRL